MKSATCTYLVLLCVCVFSPVVWADSPNVVVFLTDDQGWGDLSVNGNVNLATPNIDSLARDGATLQNFYVCHVCAPTRAEFLTGRYYPRTGVSGVSRGQGRMNEDETTVADLFKAAGYATGAFGKWHNGTQPPLHPNNRGFDEFYGFTSGHWGHYFSPPLDHNGKRVQGKGYVVDDFTQHALDFIESTKARPFFCYLPYNTPHSPMMVSDHFYAKFAGKDPPMRHRDPEREDIMMTRAALAMCENIDWNVGRVLAKLDELNLRENTIVIYFSDNGPNSYRWNGGMKGRKGAIDEGGLRSPFFIRWPRQIPSGMSIEQVTGAIDLLPTLCELTDITCAVDKPLDGRSFTSLLLGRNVPWAPRLLFAVKNNQVSVRSQRFRLDAAGRLFDITVDRGQRIDISGQHMELTAHLSRQAKRHAKEMQACFQANAHRLFHVGYGPSTTLPARDGVEHGTIKRSSRAPNNSFFTHWTRAEDFITWDVTVGTSGDYDTLVYYTCAEGDEGTTLQLSYQGRASVQARVVEPFDPPLYDKSKERVAKSHYFVKDFKPLPLGVLPLEKERGQLRLGALDIKGKQVIDVHSVELHLRQPGVREGKAPGNEVDITLSGDREFETYTLLNWQAGTSIDASGAQWKTYQYCPDRATCNTVARNVFPIQIGADWQGAPPGRISLYDRGLCPEPGPPMTWTGGLVSGGDAGMELGWRESKNSNGAGFTLNALDSTVERLRIHNVHDGFVPLESSRFTLRDSWFSVIRDDAIENDAFAFGIIDNCLFEDVYTFYSARNPRKPGRDPQANAPGEGPMIIRNCIIHMSNLPKPGWGRSSGYSSVWKESDDRAPAIDLFDNLFVMAPYTEGIASHKLDVVPDHIRHASGNVLVWLDPRPYPYTDRAEANGFKIVTAQEEGLRLYQKRRDAWLATHPGMLHSVDIGSMDDLATP